MTEQAPPSISRRTLLKAGVAGAAALALARRLHGSPAAGTGSGPASHILDDDARAVVAAIAPVMLGGTLPAGVASPVREVVTGVETAIAGLPPATRKEVDELFSLLSFAPTRCLVAGVWSPWAEASPASIAAFLESWRGSRFALLRSAHDALHQLVFGAWYANARAWPAIGYPGPPSLTGS